LNEGFIHLYIHSALSPRSTRANAQPLALDNNIASITPCTHFITCSLIYFFLNQQFITQRAKADRGSYEVATYKRNRLTRGLKLKGKEEEKEKESKKGLIEKKRKENRKPSSTWQNTLIVCKCKSIRISDQEHGSMVQ